MLADLGLKLVPILEAYFKADEFRELALMYEVTLESLEPYDLQWLSVARELVSDLDSGNNRRFVKAILELASARHDDGVAHTSFERQEFHRGMSSPIQEALSLLEGSTAPSANNDTESPGDGLDQEPTMQYVSRELLRIALAELRQKYSPLVTVSLPCMLAKDIPVSSSAAEAAQDAIQFGSTDERQWLDKYFRSPGGPGGKPYFMPGTGEWVQERYPDRTLQRRRKDFDGTVFHHPDAKRWALRAGAADELQARVLPEVGTTVSLVALMVWMWRDRELDDLDSQLSRFIEELGLDRNGLIGKVYSNEIPTEFADAGLAESPLDREELSELIGAQRPPPQAPDLAETVQVLEKELESSSFVSPPGLVARIVGGWLVGDVVVLVGPTGSGKTFLSNLLAASLTSLFGKERFSVAFLEVAPDFDSGQFIGYENLAGEFTAGRFAAEVLFTGELSDPRLVVLDEWNLAQVDAYFSPVLSSIESGRPLHLPGRMNLSRLTEDERVELLRAQPSIADGLWILPEDTFFLATCNSWIDEPETRLPMSGPVKRRCRIIQMPNILAIALERDGRAGLESVCNAFLTQERTSLEVRQAGGRESVWDEHRRSRLTDVDSVESLHDDVRNTLLTIARILLENDHTRNSFTVGIFRDVLMSCVYAESGHELQALGEQIADKVLHQINGDPKILEVITEVASDLPNSNEIEALVRRMGGFSGDSRTRPLV
jgi:hypothetical protein